MNRQNADKTSTNGDLILCKTTSMIKPFQPYPPPQTYSFELREAYTLN